MFEVFLANDEMTVYALECEKRDIKKLRMAIIAAERLPQVNKNGDSFGHQVREYLLPDPGPGLMGKLRVVVECTVCAGLSSRFGMTVVDLDAALALERDEAPSVISLDFIREPGKPKR
jgi:hypothetical protein